MAPMWILLIMIIINEQKLKQKQISALLTSPQLLTKVRLQMYWQICLYL